MKKIGVIAGSIVLVLSLTGCEFGKSENESKVDTKNNETVTEEKNDTSICTGNINAVFYGEYNSEIGNGLTISQKETLTLNEDGTYVMNIENSSSINGSYTIENGKITLVHSPEVGPSTEKITESYNISDDCSTIVIVSDYYSFNLNKK